MYVHDRLPNDVEAGKMGLKSDPKECENNPREKYESGVNAARRIWCYGLVTESTKVVVDTPQAVQ